MFTVKFDSTEEWDNPIIEAKCGNAQEVLNLIGSLKQDFGYSADQHNDWFLITRLSDGKTCHPKVKVNKEHIHSA